MKEELSKFGDYNEEDVPNNPRDGVDIAITSLMIFIGIILLILCYQQMFSSLLKSRNDKIVEQQFIKHKNECQAYFERNSGGQFNDKVVTYSKPTFLENQCSFSVCNKDVDYSMVQNIWEEINIFRNNCGWVYFKL